MNFLQSKRWLRKKVLTESLLLLLILPFHLYSLAQSEARPKLAVQLLLNTNPGSENTADGAVVFFDDRFSNSIGNEDSYKFTNPDENLAINSNGILLSIEGRPKIHGSDTLHLKMWQFRQKSYYLKLSAANFYSGLKAIVKDSYINKETVVDLSSNTLVPFSITTDQASFSPNRFAVLFKTERVMPASVSKGKSAFKENSSLSVSQDHRTSNAINLQMKNLKKGSYTISLYNKASELMYSGFVEQNESAASKRILIERRIPKGEYSLLLTSGDQTIKKIVLFQ